MAQEDNTIDLKESQGDLELVRDLNSEINNSYNSEAKIIRNSNNSNSDSVA